MSQINVKAYKVQIIESERGWGQKAEDVLFFDNEKEAKDYVTSFNKENNLSCTPDWYMFAEYLGKV